MKHTLELMNQTFSTLAIAELECDLLKARMLLEYWRARVRSLAFDMILQRGEMYFQTKVCPEFRPNFDLSEICEKHSGSAHHPRTADWIKMAIQLLGKETARLRGRYVRNDNGEKVIIEGLHGAIKKALPDNHGTIENRADLCIDIFQDLPYEWIITQ